MQSPRANVLELFHLVAQRVPAYKNFLQKEGIKPKKIETFADFQHYVPPIDKKNYLTQYPLSDLCWDGTMFHNRIISVSSGSSGVPLFWPRSLAQDQEGALIHEDLFRNIFSMHKQSTLVVVCFSMGTWIAGSFTTISALGVADRGYPLNVITPGLDKTDAVKAIKSLAGYYNQIVIAGYPPFIKDIIEEGKRSGIKWSNKKVRLLMAGESFSEEWRDYVLKLVNSRDPYHDSVNIYGSADAAILGHETPVSIAARRIYNRRPKLSEYTFGTSVLPSLVQYWPNSRYFECLNSELVLTTNAGIPLVRYNIHDTGGIVEFDELLRPIRERFDVLADRHAINVKHWRYPFIYLNGRRDFTITIYAVNIYPENIKAALLDRRIRRKVTGRFTMMNRYKNDMDQAFSINIELNGAKADLNLKKLVQLVIIEKLCKLNAEYNKLYMAIGEKAKPDIYLLPIGDTEYFARGVKHKWVTKK